MTRTIGETQAPTGTRRSAAPEQGAADDQHHVAVEQAGLAEAQRHPGKGLGEGQLDIVGAIDPADDQPGRQVEGGQVGRRQSSPTNWPGSSTRKRR